MTTRLVTGAPELPSEIILYPRADGNLIQKRKLLLNDFLRQQLRAVWEETALAARSPLRRGGGPFGSFNSLPETVANTLAHR